MIDHYLGVDLHGKRSYLVLMTTEGVIEDKCRLSNEQVVDYLKKVPCNTHAVLEATGNWSYMYDILTERVEQVDLAHPQQVRAIAAARIKNDRIDATILAHLARTNLLPTAYAAKLPIRELRDSTRHRSKLVRERTRHKNRIHRILSRYNLHAPCADLFGKKGCEWLSERIPTLSEIHQQMVQDYLAIIDALNQRIKVADQTIQAWSKTAPVIWSVSFWLRYSSILVQTQLP